MQNENKYVPPALRAGNFVQQENAAATSGQNFEHSKKNTDYLAPQSGNAFRGETRGPSNNRWNNDSGQYDNRGYGYGGSYGGGRGGYGRGGESNRGGSFYGSGPRKNELGFHGDMRPNPRVEQELFHTNESQIAGINFDRYDNIPVEVSKGCPEPYNDFSVETIGVQLLKNLVLTKFTKPTPVQKYSIPIGLNGGDLMACAQTGSGKTAGFLFPLIALMTKYGPRAEPENRRGKGSYVTSLILAPTRELAIQIFEEAQKFCYCTGIRPVVVYGGANIQLQQRELDMGVDILVATPGRLVDLIERGRVKLDCVRYLVLDEADRMLDMGFEPQIRRIVQEEGMPQDRQTFMFSATFPVEIQRLAGDFMKEYIFLAVGRVGAASKDVTQRVEWVEQNDKVDFVVDFLSRVPEGLVLIFVETKRGADHLEQVLYRNEFPASSIHGDKSQREREDALKCFKTGSTPILVATDVAARGLDIPNVTQVINFDLPSNIDDYVHRIGRTGRVGNVGHALSLMNDKNRNIARDLAELLSEAQQELPSWLSTMGFGSGGYRGKSGGRGGGGRGGHKFGAKDYRREQDSGAHSGRGSGARTPANAPRPTGYNSGSGPAARPGPPMSYGGGRGGFQQQQESWGGFSDNSAW